MVAAQQPQRVEAMFRQKIQSLLVTPTQMSSSSREAILAILEAHTTQETLQMSLFRRFLQLQTHVEAIQTLQQQQQQLRAQISHIPSPPPQIELQTVAAAQQRQHKLLAQEQQHCKQAKAILLELVELCMHDEMHQVRPDFMVQVLLLSQVLLSRAPPLLDKQESYQVMGCMQQVSSMHSLVMTGMVHKQKDLLKDLRPVREALVRNLSQAILC